MTINELIEKYADEAYQFAHEAYVIETKYLEAYEQAKKPDTALVQKLVDALRKYIWDTDESLGQYLHRIETDGGDIAKKALTEAQAWLKQQEIKE